MKGKLVVIEGIDHAGKTTQARRLVATLRACGKKTDYFREPGGTGIGEKIRALLLDPRNARMGTATELFLYMASRAQLIHERVLPSLDKGNIVVCDRYLFSSAAYQGAAGKIGIRTVLAIGRTAVQHRMPDLTIILDLDPREAAARSKSPQDRIEQRGVSYQQRVRRGFLSIARLLDSKATVINADHPKEVVQKEIERIVSHALGIRHRTR